MMRARARPTNPFQTAPISIPRNQEIAKPPASTHYFPIIEGDVAFGKQAYASDQADRPALYVTDVSHRCWRTTAEEAYVYVDLGPDIYVVDQILIYWWGSSHADTITVETSLASTDSDEWQLQSDQGDALHYYHFNRISVFAQFHKPCRFVKFNLRNGHLDPWNNRYRFGIYRIIMLGKSLNHPILASTAATPSSTRSQLHGFGLSPHGSSLRVQTSSSSNLSVDGRNAKAGEAEKCLTDLFINKDPWRETGNFTQESWRENLNSRNSFMLRSRALNASTDAHFLCRTYSRSYRKGIQENSFLETKRSSTAEERTTNLVALDKESRNTQPSLSPTCRFWPSRQQQMMLESKHCKGGTTIVTDSLDVLRSKSEIWKKIKLPEVDDDSNRYLTNQQRYFYWNMLTKESSWKDLNNKAS